MAMLSEHHNPGDQPPNPPIPGLLTGEFAIPARPDAAPPAKQIQAEFLRFRPTPALPARTCASPPIRPAA